MEFFAKQAESLELDIQWPLILSQPLIPWDLPNQCSTRQARCDFYSLYMQTSCGAEATERAGGAASALQAFVWNPRIITIQYHRCCNVTAHSQNLERRAPSPV